METFIYHAIGILIFVLYPVWRIFRRAGLNPVFSLVVFVPYGGVFIAGLILAFSKWQVSASPAMEV